MSSNRRVHFADVPHKSSDQAALAAPSSARNSQASSQLPHEFIESQALALESSRTEHLENVHLAAQRAHDAVMMARSMQADIRSSNARLQSFGQGFGSEGTRRSPSDLSAVQRTPSEENHSGSFPELQNIISSPMAWITDVFNRIK
jgi:hypothetical protein